MTTDAEIWTALIAGAAFVLAAVSLLAQWLMWKRSGARLKVRCFKGALVEKSGARTEVLTIRASNAGRGSAQLVGLTLLEWGTGREWTLNWALDTRSDVLPQALEGGHQAHWYIPWPVVESQAGRSDVVRVRPRAHLGSNETFDGEWFWIKRTSTG